MSFLGSVATDVRKLVAEAAPSLDGPALVCCAGNFTLASALRSGGYVHEIEACDITLYTSALGAYLSGQELEVKERPTCPEHLRGFLQVDSPESLAASVALMLEMRQFWKGQHYWQVRQLEERRRLWPEFMKNTVERLRVLRDHMGKIDYRAQDVLEFLDQRDRGVVFIAPPTFGTQDYVNQERLFKAVCKWKRPEYTEIDFQDVGLYERIVRFDNYFVVMERPFDGAEEVLGEPVAVVHKGRRSTIYVYARSSPKKMVSRAVLRSEAAGPIRDPRKPVTGKERIGLAVLTHPQTVRMNELFMSVRVDYYLADIGLSLALIMDGEIVGKMDFKRTTHRWALEPQRMIYVQSDLAVPSCEKRLSKLVLMAMLSHEVKEMVDETFQDDHAYAVTTAFSRHPVSMKYRGVFKLHKRLENDGGSERYRLNYYGKMGQWSLSDAFLGWQKKYGTNQNN